MLIYSLWLDDNDGFFLDSVCFSRFTRNCSNNNPFGPKEICLNTPSNTPNETLRPRSVVKCDSSGDIIALTLHVLDNSQHLSIPPQLKLNISPRIAKFEKLNTFEVFGTYYRPSSNKDTRFGFSRYMLRGELPEEFYRLPLLRNITLFDIHDLQNLENLDLLRTKLVSLRLRRLSVEVTFPFPESDPTNTKLPNFDYSPIFQLKTNFSLPSKFSFPELTLFQAHVIPIRSLPTEIIAPKLSQLVYLATLVSGMSIFILYIAFFLI